MWRSIFSQPRKKDTLSCFLQEENFILIRTKMIAATSDAQFVAKRHEFVGFEFFKITFLCVAIFGFLFCIRFLTFNTFTELKPVSTLSKKCTIRRVDCTTLLWKAKRCKIQEEYCNHNQHSRSHLTDQSTEDDNGQSQNICQIKKKIWKSQFFWQTVLKSISNLKYFYKSYKNY